eukprot:TRINITY_DN43882_c0_g1_i1.p1 TRINITY_DN43882_c0_g1~~TRINITY_DN43882_c0_g1_i1.p1  ORF type:complete len:265 (+),score=28.32 TRINITY_DN43882_c0_g1_i1:55-849(+)
MPLLAGPGSKVCAPDWHLANKTCPHGSTPIFERCHFIDPLAVATWTWPNEHQSLVLDAVAACFSSLEIPLSWIPVLLLLGLLVGSRLRTSLLLMVSGYWVVVEPTKKALKGLVKQPRPSTSCLWSCGMPSGHSVVALFFWTWFILSIATRRKPPSQTHVVVNCILANAILLPIPWSRVQLGDHSTEQVLAGSAVGVAVGMVWFLFLSIPGVARAIAALASATEPYFLALQDDYYTFWGGSRMCDHREAEDGELQPLAKSSSPKK